MRKVILNSVNKEKLGDFCDLFIVPELYFCNIQSNKPIKVQFGPPPQKKKHLVSLFFYQNQNNPKLFLDWTKLD